MEAPNTCASRKGKYLLLLCARQHQLSISVEGTPGFVLSKECSFLCGIQHVAQTDSVILLHTAPPRSEALPA